MKNDLCIELATKHNSRIYFTEKCGCKSKYKIQYELKGKLIEKTLCKRHLKSVTAWLERINVQYEIKDTI